MSVFRLPVPTASTVPVLGSLLAAFGDEDAALGLGLGLVAPDDDLVTQGADVGFGRGLGLGGGLGH